MESEFVDAVAKMRSLQKRYFATRSRSVLRESKNLEQRVDQMLAEIGSGVIQPDLFGGGGDDSKAKD